MNTKLILQASLTALVLGIGSGVIPATMSAAQAFQPIASEPDQAQHATQQGVPEDFIFASNYTWLGRN
ncbi:MAG TPA: hypothetical protein VEH51_01030 [Burkholderiales bacterium]|nr:hypothetical protein [Burkholderiales bacterium]